jgi:tetratricopeptide (TPR) repeat protein
VLAKLSVFQGGFTATAALEVAGATVTMIEHLCDAALVQIVSLGRFTFHALLHSYVAAKLTETETLELETHDAHAAYFASRMAAVNRASSGAASAELIGFMLGEDANVLAMLRHLLQKRQYADLVGLAEPLLWHMGLSGRLEAGTRLFAEVLEALPENDPSALEARVSFATSYGWSHLFVGDFAAGVMHCETAAKFAQRSSDPLQASRAFDALAQAYYRAGHFAQSPAIAEQALVLAREIGDDVRVARVLSTLGLAAAVVADQTRANQAFAQAVELHQSSRLPDGIDAVWLYTYFGCAQMLFGTYAEALTTLEAGYAIISKNPAVLGILEAIMQAIEALSLLEIGLQEGDSVRLERAERLSRAALPITERTGQHFVQSFLLVVLGRLGLARRDPKTAGALLEGMRLAYSNHIGLVLSWAVPYQAEVLLEAGNHVLAAKAANFVLTNPASGVFGQAAAHRVLSSLEFMELPTAKTTTLMSVVETMLMASEPKSIPL